MTLLYQDLESSKIFCSKTDQYRDWAVVVIARTGTECCPVVILGRYMQVAGI